MITGASDGLGAEFARQSAREGFNLVLVSRTESKLQKLAEELSSKYQIKCEIVAMDCSANRDADFAKLKAVTDKIEIRVLINNVGQSHDIPVEFAHSDLKELDSIISINCEATLKITHLLLPRLKMAKGRALILTMGSFAGLTPVAMLATYSASKAFLAQWSGALEIELAKSKEYRHIEAKLINSYLVCSAMSKIKRPSFLIPSATTFVKSAVNKIGGWPHTHGAMTPYWQHAIYQYIIGIAPTKVVDDISYSSHVNIRERALRKIARNQKSQ